MANQKEPLHQRLWTLSWEAIYKQLLILGLSALLAWLSQRKMPTALDHPAEYWLLTTAVFSGSFGVLALLWQKITALFPQSEKSNIRLLEIPPSEEGRLLKGKYLGQWMHEGEPVHTYMACFRNEPIRKGVPVQPCINAHIVYKNHKNKEFDDQSHALWKDESEQYAKFAVGDKKCLILLSLNKENKPAKWFRESYHSNGFPCTRPVSKEIVSIPRRIIVEFLDEFKGNRIRRFVLNAKWNPKTSTLEIKLQHRLWALIRRD